MFHTQLSRREERNWVCNGKIASVLAVEELYIPCNEFGLRSNLLFSLNAAYFFFVSFLTLSLRERENKETNTQSILQFH